jgi:Sec-independent protein secretion pathway component TatC
MANAAGTVMPMVDHLEELRRRLFWSLGAVALATGAALFVVFTFPVIRLLELPIRPYLPTHKLAFTHPTDPFDIAMHTSIAFGVVAALPILLHQVWGFIRPAMTKPEERVVRWVIGGSLVLFAAGVALAWGLVLPLAVQWLMGLQTDALTPIITAREYFAFASTWRSLLAWPFNFPSSSSAWCGSTSSLQNDSSSSGAPRCSAARWSAHYSLLVIWCGRRSRWLSRCTPSMS